jgi:hypothetical protein
MRTTKTKPSKQGKTVKKKKISPDTENKPLSSIAKYWQTVEEGDWEIVDMRAVLK